MSESSQRPSRFGMRFKACAFVLLIVATALGVASSALILDTQTRLRADRQQTAHSLARSLAHSSELALAVGDVRELGRMAKAFVDFQGALLVDIKNAEGLRVARSGIAGGDWERLAESPESLGHFVAIAPVSTVEEVPALGEDVFDEEPGDSVSTVVIGQVAVTISGAPTNLKIAEYRRRSLWIVALTSLVLLPLILWGVGLWTGRLETVVAASERIARGDLTCSLPEESRDEIGRLCRSHETMRGALIERDRQMRAFNDTLQQQVVERTQDLMVQRDRAEEASRAKSEFLANISHELRTPMHGILSFATFGIKRSGLPEQARLRGYFEKIERSGGVLLHLLNNLLDLSKLGADGVELQTSPHRVDSLLQPVLEEFESLVETQQVALEFVCRVETLAVLDAVRIRQVVRNLISNALRFSPVGGRVLLQATEVAEHGGASCLRIVVEDQGVGIPAGELDAVFDAFVQSSLTKTGAGGTGLGLSISREIISLHGGKIWAENCDPCGARFVFEIPVGARAQEPVAALAAVGGSVAIGRSE